MEDVMDVPCFGKIDSICNIRDFSSYLKRSIPSW